MLVRWSAHSLDPEDLLNRYSEKQMDVFNT